MSVTFDVGCMDVELLPCQLEASVEQARIGYDCYGAGDAVEG